MLQYLPSDRADQHQILLMRGTSAHRCAALLCFMTCAMFTETGSPLPPGGLCELLWLRWCPADASCERSLLRPLAGLCSGCSEAGALAAELRFDASVARPSEMLRRGSPACRLPLVETESAFERASIAVTLDKRGHERGPS